VGLGLHTQAVLLGAFILAKAKGGPEAAVECVLHLRRYLELLFGGGIAHTGNTESTGAV
jgi:TetR/AcrR family transcriptional repressor of nem operon